VNEDAWASEIERLEELVAGAAGAMAFPLLAEAHRRAGRPEAAERVAREGLARSPGVSAGRVALALALLDQKRGAEAGAELERLLGSESEHGIARHAAAGHAPVAGHREPPVFGAGEVLDGELDSAFDLARAEREQMLGADDVAHAALASLPDEGEAETHDAPAAGSGLELADAAPGPAPGSPFATETVAGLLERQGHGREAERIRAALTPTTDAAQREAADDGEPAAASTGERRGNQATLERWLGNLRRDKG